MKFLKAIFIFVVLISTKSFATAQVSDYLIIDTAGRLHNKSDLMAELEKVKRFVKREIEIDDEIQEENLIEIEDEVDNNAEIIIENQMEEIEEKVYQAFCKLTHYMCTCALPRNWTD